MNVAARDTRELILASASPRRKHLLSEAGYKFTALPAAVDETFPEGAKPEDAVVELALRKAKRVAVDLAGEPVLGADTLVVLDERVLGKPESVALARQMLVALSGRTHRVVTGVALVVGERSWTGFDVAHVTFRTLSEREIDLYLESAHFADKAGAYGIQEHGRSLVAEFVGRLDTIIGLPIHVLDDLWKQMQGSLEQL